MTHRQSTTPAPIDWDVIAPPRPPLAPGTQAELDRQATEPLQTYLRRLAYEQA